MSSLSNGSVAAFRPETGCITIRCASKFEFIWSWSNLAKIHYGKAVEPLESFSADELLWRTCLFHELRHWNDFLLSYWGFEIFRRKAQLALNAYYFFRLNSWPADGTLPYPVLDWALSSTEERQEYSAWMNSAWNTPNCKWFDPGDFSESYLSSPVSDSDDRALLKVCIRDALSIRNMHAAGISADMAVQDVFELGAMARQTLSIFRMSGYPGIRMLGGKLRSQYYGNLLDIGNPWLAHLPLDAILRMHSLISTYSLVTLPPPGPTTARNDMPHLYPGLRMAKLLGHLRIAGKRTLVEISDDASAAMRYFSEVMEEPPFIERVRATSDCFRRRFGEIAQLAKCNKHYRNPEVDSAVLDYSQLLLHGRDRIADVVSAKMDSFANGALEAEEALETIMPPIIFDISAMSVDDRKFVASTYNIVNDRCSIFLSDEMSDAQENFSRFSHVEDMASHLMFDSSHLWKHQSGFERSLQAFLPGQRLVRYIPQ